MARAKNLTLKACAVNVLRMFPQADDGELAELIKRLAVKRGIKWAWGHEVTEAIEIARRYAAVD